MAIVANTVQTYGIKGIREELSDIIYNISPADVPFMSNAGKGPKPGNTFFEWQLDSLASADNTNARIEGDDKAAFDSVAATSRVGNYTQISDKSLIVSGTTEEVNKAGRKSETAYQIAKKGLELKRDIETILCGTNQAAAVGATGTARKTASLLAFVRTNTDKGATGADPAAPNPAYGGTRTDGTQRPFTETVLKNIMQLQWGQGGHVDTLMVGGAQKQVVSGFSGIATKYVEGKSSPMTTIGAVDVYVSDFGTLQIVPNRFQRNRDAWFLDFDLIQLRWLRPIRKYALAKTGDAEKAMLLGEYGLQVDQEAGLGLAADLS